MVEGGKERKRKDIQEIILENFSNLLKNINLHIQEV